ncbi:hypothetical protein TURU_056606 [Turdus rufiventris]|nr:hypothetical protein TURU_056606 [Turdus rufiventris]
MKFSRDCGCARAALLLLLLLLLLPLVPGAAAASLPHADSSGEAELDEAAAARRAELPDSLRQAQLLHARAAELQDEMCEKFTVCQNSMEMLLRNNLNLPKVINPEEVIIPDAATQESLHTKLKSIKAWTEKITIHLILRDFTSFMEKTVRAVRYLKNTRSFSV